MNKSNLFKALQICIFAVQTNIPTRTHTGLNTATNKLRRVKSCQAEHRVKIRHPCPPSQAEMSWSILGQFQGERWQLIVDGEKQAVV